MVPEAPLTSERHTPAGTTHLSFSHGPSANPTPLPATLGEDGMCGNSNGGHV